MFVHPKMHSTPRNINNKPPNNPQPGEPESSSLD